MKCNRNIIDQLNRPFHDLRISIIDRCNFRCSYCMPEDQFHHSYEFINKEQWLTFEEIERVVKVFVGLGLKKIRITGGEPLIRPEIERLIHKFTLIEGINDIALTTNGSLLADHAENLKKAGLNRLTVSLDSLDPQTFRTLNGFKGNVDQVLAGIKVARLVGFEAIKINAVIRRGINEDSILDLVRFAREERHTLRFIEYMDVGNQNHWDLNQVVFSKEIIDKINKFFPLKAIGGTEDGGTSERFCFVDGRGEIGFISSVSQPFCGTCNRLRLSADGKIYTCLFTAQGIDLSGYLRNGVTDDFLEGFMREVWQNRQDRYSEMRSQISEESRHMPKIEMFQIGG